MTHYMQVYRVSPTTHFPVQESNVFLYVNLHILGGSLMFSIYLFFLFLLDLSIMWFAARVFPSFLFCVVKCEAGF